MQLALGALKHESDSGMLYRSMVMTPSEIQTPGRTGSMVQRPASTIAEPATKSKTPMIAGAVGIAALVIGGIVWSQMNKPAPQPAPAPAQTPVAVAPTPAPAPAPAPVPDATLTNDGIIDMVKAKVPMEVIYSQLRTAPKNFDLSAGAIIKLTNAGVPLTVIEGMRDPKTIPAAKAAPAPAKNAEKGVPTTAAATSPAKSDAAVPPVAPAAAPAPPVAEVVASRPAPSKGEGKQVLLADGSPFAIALTADIPDNAKEGVQLRFASVADVRVGDSIVIAKGAVATGQITQGKRLMGKMQLRLLTVTGVDGKLYKIRALSSRTNKTQERPVETGVKPKGEKVAADAGTQYIAYVDGDMTVTVRNR